MHSRQIDEENFDSLHFDYVSKFDDFTIQDYGKSRRLGEGTYGIVYEGLNIKTKEKVAIKKIRLDGEDNGIPATTLREVDALKKVKHPNIVQLQQCFVQVGSIYLIFEYCAMDLRKHLDNQAEKKTYLTPDFIRKISYQLLQGMAFCHHRGVIHRDLKPQNLLFDPESHVLKIADFGLARAVNFPLRQFTHEVITLWYRPPEILLGADQYTMAVDIWSIACILLEVATLHPFFHGDSEMDQLFKIFRILGTPSETSWPGISKLSAFKPEFPKWHGNRMVEKLARILNPADISQFADMLQHMLIYKPEMRWHCKACLKHAYFAGFDRSSVPAFGEEDDRLDFDRPLEEILKDVKRVE